jgi:small-conductance mechanosensitive channel
VQLQHSIVAHLALQSLSWIAFFILCAVLLAYGARALLERITTDRRSLHTLRTIAILGIQLVTLLLILLVIFGPPNQVPTILGLGAAGLTVVFQDFILAFFGWFILMGRNGIRVGDWVEINGVGGEVVDIGLFRTALLETGNWTDKGHPTGRRVTFINNFAITGQYFNFSTTGQWMWDEITVNIPPGVDSGRTIQAIHDTVLKETEQDSKLAEQEWQRTASQNGLSQFKATPSVDMRPAASGVDIVVRYVIRAGNRFEMRNRLYQSIIDLLHQPQAELQRTTA